MTDLKETLVTLRALALMAERPRTSEVANTAYMAIDLIQRMGAENDELRQLVENMTREPNEDTLVRLQLENARLRKAIAAAVDSLDDVLRTAGKAGVRA